MSKREKKAKEEILTIRKCKKIKRPDKLVMRTVAKYTFPSFLEAIISRYGKKLCYSIFNEEDTSALTYKALGYKVRAVSAYLDSRNIKKGDKVAIYGDSSPNWMIFYLGLTSIGGIAVPILPGFSKSEAENAFSHSGISAICLQKTQYATVQDYIREKDLMVFRLEDLFEIPKESVEKATDAKAFENAPGFDSTKCKLKLKPVVIEEDDIASIIYTSGTTGNSKGVVLSHMNILRNADWCTDKFVKIKPGYRVLSILPMSHVYEFTIGQVLTMMAGCEIHFLGKPPAVSILLPALKKIRPNIMLTVPLLIEKVYKSAILPVLRDNKRVGKLLKTPVLSSVVYSTVGKKLKLTFGGKLKFFGIGGAALDPEVEEFLYKAKFPYAPGYGLTETSPLIAGSGPSYRKLGIVGPIVEDIDLKLLDRDSDGVGEIAVKGVSVMKGYYNNEELNKEAFTEDGYFRTGDLGIVNKKGGLTIKGRCKTMILGPAGENIYPESIEYLINNQEFVQESLVVPENGGLLALVKIDIELMANNMKISIDDAKLEAAKYLNSLKTRINNELSRQNRIDSVQLQDEPFDRTATFKIKRFLYPKKKATKDTNDEKKDNE